MENRFLLIIFIVVLALSVIVGVGLNIYYDVRAKADLAHSLENAIRLANEGKKEEFLNFVTPPIYEAYHDISPPKLAARKKAASELYDALAKENLTFGGVSYIGYTIDRFATVAKLTATTKKSEVKRFQILMVHEKQRDETEHWRPIRLVDVKNERTKAFKEFKKNFDSMKDPRKKFAEVKKIIPQLVTLKSPKGYLTKHIEEVYKKYRRSIESVMLDTMKQYKGSGKKYPLDTFDKVIKTFEEVGEDIDRRFIEATDAFDKQLRSLFPKIEKDFTEPADMKEAILSRTGIIKSATNAEIEHRSAMDANCDKRTEASVKRLISAAQERDLKGYREWYFGSQKSSPQRKRDWLNARKIFTRVASLFETAYKEDKESFIRQVEGFGFESEQLAQKRAEAPVFFDSLRKLLKQGTGPVNKLLFPKEMFSFRFSKYCSYNGQPSSQKQKNSILTEENYPLFEIILKNSNKKSRLKWSLPEIFFINWAAPTTLLRAVAETDVTDKTKEKDFHKISDQIESLLELQRQFRTVVGAPMGLLKIHHWKYEDSHYDRIGRMVILAFQREENVRMLDESFLRPKGDIESLYALFVQKLDHVEEAGEENWELQWVPVKLLPKSGYWKFLREAVEKERARQAPIIKKAS